MSQQIIEQIKAKLAAKGALDELSLASQGDLVEAEGRLGFKIPALLSSVYLNVSNGGFGPGYGIIGLAGGHESDLGNLAETYEEVKRGAAYLGLDWTEGLLPFCGWGCNIFTCVDCTDPRCRVFRSEECRAAEQGYVLEDFFQMWLDDRDIKRTDVSVRKRRNYE